MVLYRRVFCSPRGENFGIAMKSTVFGSAAQRKFWNCEQKHCIWVSRAEKKALYFISSAEKSFGFATKSSVFCSAVQRNIFELRTKPPRFVQPRTEKILNRDQKHCILSSRAEKSFGIANFSRAAEKC
jgi:hypothetical protein